MDIGLLISRTAFIPVVNSEVSDCGVWVRGGDETDGSTGGVFPFTRVLTFLSCGLGLDSWGLSETEDLHGPGGNTGILIGLSDLAVAFGVVVFGGVCNRFGAVDSSFVWWNVVVDHWLSDGEVVVKALMEDRAGFGGLVALDIICRFLAGLNSANDFGQ